MSLNRGPNVSTVKLNFKTLVETRMSDILIGNFKKKIEIFQESINCTRIIFTLLKKSVSK